MWKKYFVLVSLIIVTAAMSGLGDSGNSTRVVDANEYARSIGGRYPYRQKSEYILGELDLKPGDVVVDIGAGDGWWAGQMADKVGPEGSVHAGEVEREKVETMRKRLEDVPQVKPYLCPLDGTGLAENTCDLAFLSKTYHHLSEHVEYLRHLREVVRPDGRLCVIEAYPRLADGRGRRHAWCPGLLTQQAAEAGWVLVRCEMIAGTGHYIALFVPRDLFRDATRGED